MIEILEKTLRWLVYWECVLIVINFLVACTEHEWFLWLQRNPARAERLSDWIDERLARLQHRLERLGGNHDA